MREENLIYYYHYNLLNLSFCGNCIDKQLGTYQKSRLHVKTLKRFTLHYPPPDAVEQYDTVGLSDGGE